MVQPERILVAGAARLPRKYVPFAEELGRALMRDTKFVLVTGGLKQRKPESLATDFVVANAALDQLNQMGDTPQSRIMTVLPEADVPGFERFQVGKVLEIKYSNVNARRFSIALSSSAVLTIHGRKGTGEIIDLAHAADVPLIPIPATGGSSGNRWDRYEKAIKERLRISQQEVASLRAGEPADVVRVCISLLKRVLRPRCFVAMPIDGHPMPNVYETIKSALAKKGYQSIRIDQENIAGNIVDAIWAGIKASDLAIVDLTNSRPNVYYELGICHALDKPTVLITYSEEGEVPDDVPFDIRVQNIHPYGTTDSLRAQLHGRVREAPTAGFVRAT